MSKNNIGPKRLVVGAHYGLKEWMIQRVTAIVMVVFTIVLPDAARRLDELERPRVQLVHQRIAQRMVGHRDHVRLRQGGRFPSIARELRL